MRLETEDLVYLCEFAIEAARAAGKHIAENSVGDVQVNRKSDQGTYASQVVTEVDLECDKIILGHLQSTIEKFDLGLLTEETEDRGDRLEKDYFWCVDPLDGTLPFIEKTHGYSVSIALVSKSGEPQIGVIYDPKEALLYHAIAGVGAFKNEDMWLLEPPQSSKTLTWIMDRSLLDDPRFGMLQKELESYAEKKGQELKTIQIGGGALNACWVLECAPACYLKLPKKSNGGGSLWDYSASACIHEWMDGSVTDIFGGALELNRKESTYLNHRGVLYSSDTALAKDLMELCQRIHNTHSV